MTAFYVDKKFQRFEDVTLDILRQEKVKLLLCDLDNTLRLHSEKEPVEELVEWVETLKKGGIEIVIISNNGRKKMMQKFCEPLGIECVWWAKKPVSTKLTETIERYKANPEETVMLGDKWYTDVLAGKFAKIRSWQVEPRKDIV